MRTNRKGHAIELLCETCDQPYAEIFPDRLSVYSFHFGRYHASGFPLGELEKVRSVAESGDYLEIKCSACNLLPCAIVQAQRLTLTTKHKAQHWQVHSNALTLDDIAQICMMIGPSDVILPTELDVPLAQIEQAS
jgi:hypothetical protein